MTVYVGQDANQLPACSVHAHGVGFAMAHVKLQVFVDKRTGYAAFAQAY